MSPAVYRRVEGRHQHVMLVTPTAIIDLTPRQAEDLAAALDFAALPLDACRHCLNLAEWGGLCAPCSDAEDEDRSAP